MSKSHHIINKFLAKEFLKAFCLVFFSILGIITLFTIIQEMKSDAAKLIPFGKTLLYSLLNALWRTPTTIPLSVLLSGSLAFWRLSRSSELVIVRATGLSVWKFLSPIMAVCIALGLFNATVISPISSAMLKEQENTYYKYGVKNGNPMNFSQTGLWLKENTENSKSFMFIGTVKKNPDNSLSTTNITIFTIDESNNFKERIEADQGLLTNRNFHLENITVISPDLTVNTAQELIYPTSLSINRIEQNSSEPESFSFWELPGFIKFFEEAGFSARKHKEFFYQLLFMPILLISMLFISAIFSISPKRSQGNLALKLTGGILIGFVVFFMHQIISAMGVSGRLPLLISTITVPIIAILSCSTVLLFEEDG